jgi:hypothetical protein
VLRMPKIYQAADITIVRLGESTAESDKAMDFMNQNDRRIVNIEADLLQAGNYRDEYLALVRGLLIRPWWGRMWIVQEVTISNDLTIACGSKSVRWEVLIAFINIVHLYRRAVVSQVLREVDPEEVHHSNFSVKLYTNRREWYKSGPQPIFRLTIEFRSWKATVPVDKIYGLLGMAAEANHPTLKPNYEILPQKVFRTIARFFIEQQQRLDFLCIATGPRRLAHLPSWPPDFTVPGSDIAPPLKGTRRLLERYLYSAAKDFPMAVTFSDDSDIMYADGIRADSIERPAPHWDPGREHNDFVENLLESTQMVWFNLLQPVIPVIVSLYGPGFSLGTALGKLLTADRVTDSKSNISRFEPDKSWSDLPTEPPEDFKEIGRAEEQIISWEDSKKHMIESALTQRRFVVTKTGYIGLVPELTEVEDIICILLGCDTPLVLRPINDHYILIGESYICGLMDGEQVDYLQEGRAVKDCFEIR